MSSAVTFHEVAKRFGPVRAVDGVSFTIEEGTIHALVGENGAGKSTLIGMLSGFLEPDRGEIRVFGRTLHPVSPGTALAAGVGLSAQHFHQVPTLTGFQNIVLGLPSKTNSDAGVRGALRELMQRYQLETELDRAIEDLSVGEQERIEILGLLYRGARLLVLDEPTAVLAPSEVEGLFAVLRKLKAEGKTILLVTHKLPEVMAIADRVTVVRRGCVVETRDVSECDPDRLAGLIVGGVPPPALSWEEGHPGDPVLELRGVSAGERGSGVEDITLTVRAGEIVGIGGVEGNGQRALVQAICGLIPVRAGSIHWGAAMDGVRAGAPSTRNTRRLRASLGWIPEDRRREGLLLGSDLVANAALGLHEREPLARRGWLDEKALRDHAVSIVESFGVEPGDVNLPAAALSGGNQQRLLVGRELSRRAPFLLAVHPTRGVDLKATSFLHAQILAERRRGAAVLLVTADLTELRDLSDQLAILYRGRIAYSATRAAAREDALQCALVGLAPEQNL